MNTSLQKRSFEDLQRHVERCSNCQNTASFVYRFKSRNVVEILRSFWYCGSYMCDKCAYKKKIQLRRALSRLKFKDTCRFLTLTLSTKDYSPEESICKISEFFNLWVKFMRYRGFKFQYFKIIEFTKKDVAHLHILVNAFLPGLVVQQCWKQITGSYIYKIKKPENKEHTINYLLKYITKANNDFAQIFFYLYQKRRYSYSQNFFETAKEEQAFVQSMYYHNRECEFEASVLKFFNLKYDTFKLLEFVYLN